MLTDKNIEDMATCLQAKHNLSLQRLNLSANKITYRGVQLLLQAMTHRSAFQISNINLDRSTLEKPIVIDAQYFAFCRSLHSILAVNRKLSSLSLNNCNLGKEAVLAIGEGLAKNTTLLSLSLRGNQITLKYLAEFILACKDNKRLGLRHLDLSSNNLCDKAGIHLAKCLKGLQFLESINMKNNCFEADAGDAFLFLVKENPVIQKCQLELNMMKVN